MIVDVKEVAGRSGTIGEESTRTFIFYTNSTSHSERDIYFHRVCPRIGSQHPDRRFSRFFLKRGDLTISQGTGSERLKWTVVAKYTQLDPGEEEPEEQPDAAKGDAEEPDFQPHVTVEFEEYSSPIDLGINVGAQSTSFDEDSPAGVGAYPVVNSALEPYETPPEIFKQNAIIRVTRNLGLRSSLWKAANDLRNTINTDKFTFRRGTFVLKIYSNQCRIKIRVGEQEEYQTKTGKTKQYASLEVQFIIDQRTWNIDVLDYGTVYLDTAGKTIETRISDNDWGLAGGTEQVPIEDKNRNRVQGLLDGTGEKLTNGEAAVFNRYPGYDKAKHASFFKRMTRRVRKKK